MKKWILFAVLAVFVPGLRAASGRWKQATDKKTGLAEVRLTSSHGKVLKAIPAQGKREYVPVPAADVKDSKLRDRAKQRGLGFQRLVAKEIATTILDGGRLLLVQEQRVVMPPIPIDPGNLFVREFAEWNGRGPEQNNIVVSLYDDDGETLWTRVFGPIAGPLPAVRPVWTPPVSAASASSATAVSPTR